MSTNASSQASSSVVPGQPLHQVSPSDQALGAPTFTHLRPVLRTIRRIPKPVRASCAAALADTLDDLVEEPRCTKAGQALLHFGFSFLRVSERDGKRRNISSILLKRPKARSTSPDDHPDRPAINRKGDAGSARAVPISTKLEEGNITAAVRMLSSDDRPINNNNNNIIIIIIIMIIYYYYYYYYYYNFFILFLFSPTSTEPVDL